MHILKSLSDLGREKTGGREIGWRQAGAQGTGGKCQNQGAGSDGARGRWKPQDPAVTSGWGNPKTELRHRCGT